MLLKLEQGSKPVIEFSPDLKGTLRQLEQTKPVWPSKFSLIDFARGSLGVAPENEDAWYRKAWWSYYAARIIHRFDWLGLDDEIMGLLEGEVDFSPVADALSEGKGAILAGAHVNLGYVSNIALLRAGFKIVTIAASKREGGGKIRNECIVIDNEKDLKVSLARAMKYLRRDHIVIAAPTGHLGKRFVSRRFLGQDISVNLGIGELARITGAPTLWATCTWTGIDRFKLSFERLPTPEEEREGEAWLEQWYDRYFEKLERQMRDSPSDLGFRWGIWNPREGGLHWYKNRVTRKAMFARWVSRLFRRKSC